jgi:hypothetical protein
MDIVDQMNQVDEMDGSATSSGGTENRRRAFVETGAGLQLTEDAGRPGTNREVTT